MAEAWIQSLQWCFGLHPYGSNLKARLAVHQLRGDASNWWHQEEMIGGMSMDTLTWETFLELDSERGSCLSTSDRSRLRNCTLYIRGVSQ